MWYSQNREKSYFFPFFVTVSFILLYFTSFLSFLVSTSTTCLPHHPVSLFSFFFELIYSYYFIVKLLLQLGPLYRIVMYGVAFVFKFITRFICVETILAILPREKPLPKKTEQKKVPSVRSKKID